MASGRVSSELRDAAVSGARWTGIARVARELVAFAATVTLARLVSPAEFGHATIALTVVALTALLGTAGCTAPLVQRRELTDRLVGAGVVLCVSLAGVLTLATAGASVVIVAPVFGGRTAELVLLAAPAWLLAAAGAPSVALLQRALRFRALAVVESLAAVLASLTAVVYSLVGAGDTALVVGGLVLIASTALAALFAAPPGTARTDGKTLRETVGFAAPLAASSLVYIGYRNVDYLIVGAQTSPTQLGYYWRAFQLAVVYQSKISNIMQRVSLPVFARSRSREELRALHDRMVRTHASVLVPLLAAFIAAAPVAVPWVFGSAWTPAVAPAQIMAVAGMSEAIMAGIGPLMVSIGRPGVLLRFNLAAFALYAVTIYALVPFGLEAVAVGVASFGVLVVIGFQLFVRRPFVGLTWRDLWLETRAGIVTGVGVLATGTAVRESLEALDTPAAALLGLVGAAVLVVYIGLLRSLFPGELDSLRRILGAVSGRSSARRFTART